MDQSLIFGLVIGVTVGMIVLAVKILLGITALFAFLNR